MFFLRQRAFAFVLMFSFGFRSIPLAESSLQLIYILEISEHVAFTCLGGVGAAERGTSATEGSTRGSYKTGDTHS